jgi:hypothetical protein
MRSDESEGPSQERRHFRRLSLAIPCILAARHPDSRRPAQILTGVIVNIGGGGIAIRSHEALRVGTLLQLAFKPQSHLPGVRVYAEVLDCTALAGEQHEVRARYTEEMSRSRRAWISLAVLNDQLAQIVKPWAS